MMFLVLNAFSQINLLRDTVFFKNGTKVIGELDKIKLGVVSFDPDEANDITVQLVKLKSIAAERKIYRIETVSNHVYFGKLRTCGKDDYVAVDTGGKPIIIRLVDISVLYPYRNSFIKRFTGTAGAGFNYTKSSGFGRFNANANINYRTKNEEITLSASSIYTISDSVFSRDNEDVDLKYNYYLSPTYFLTGLFQYQRNLELDLERRFQEGLGAGSKFITSNRVYAWMRLGASVAEERGTDGTDSGALYELFYQLEFNFFRFTKPKVTFTVSETAYYGLTESNRIRTDGQADLDWEIVKNLNLDLSIYHNYDSRPSGGGGGKTDYGTLFGVNYSF